MTAPRSIAALYVETGGCYFDLPGVDPWDEPRDARLYDGPYPVVAHPPCQRWGRYWGGSPTTWPRLKLGDDDGCFAAALAAVRKFGGVIEHPEASHAWRHFGISLPPKSGGWISAGLFDPGWTCCVEQGSYGHEARKATWLYVIGCDLPDLRWGKADREFLRLESGFHTAEERAAWKATRGERPAMPQRKRNATPPEFRDLLIGIARTAIPFGFAAATAMLEARAAALAGEGRGA
jgi:hypothetical protein